MRSPKRVLTSLLLVACLAVTIFIIYKAFQKDEWNTIASALAVITAVSAIWSSLNLTWNQEDEKRPTISLYFETKTHKYATNLVIENIGGGPAYNVKIEWLKPILDYQGSAVRFTDFENEFDLAVLPAGKSYSRFVKGTVKLFEDYKSESESMIFEGNVSYSLNKSSKTRFKESFQVSMEPHKRTLNALNDQMDFYAENKELAKRIKELNNTLKRFQDSQTDSQLGEN